MSVAPDPAAVPWYIRHRMRALLLWAGGAFGFGLIVFTIVVVVFVNKVKASEPYALALAEVRQSPEVRQALGQPLEPRWLAFGLIDADAGYSELTFTVDGPTGRGTVRAVAEHGLQGDWRLVYLSVATFADAGVEVVELITEKPPTGPDLPEPTPEAKERYGVDD